MRSSTDSTAGHADLLFRHCPDRSNLLLRCRWELEPLADLEPLGTRPRWAIYAAPWNLHAQTSKWIEPEGEKLPYSGAEINSLPNGGVSAKLTPSGGAGEASALHFFDLSSLIGRAAPRRRVAVLLPRVTKLPYSITMLDLVFYRLIKLAIKFSGLQLSHAGMC